jgi:DNA-binding CsgD family transcriptional regulator
VRARRLHQRGRVPRDFLGHVRSEVPKHQPRTASRDREIAGRFDGDLQNGIPQLSDRERSILHCLIQGASNKMIARRIGIAESTVKVHVKTILRKIRAHNRTQAAIWAMSNNVFTSTREAGLLSHSPVLLLDNSGTDVPRIAAVPGGAAISPADLHGPLTTNGAGGCVNGG